MSTRVSSILIALLGSAILALAAFTVIERTT